MNIQAMRFVVHDLAVFQNPDLGWYAGDNEDGEADWNHWTGAKDNLEVALGHKLSDEEITLLSLSLCYGPTPALVDGERADVLVKLWPEGNPRGGFLQLEEVLRVLEGGEARVIETPVLTRRHRRVPLGTPENRIQDW